MGIRIPGMFTMGCVDKRHYKQTLSETAREYFVRWCDEKKLSQEAIGALLGAFSQPTIGSFYKGERQMSLPLLIALRPHLRLSIDEMLGLPPMGIYQKLEELKEDVAHRNRRDEEEASSVRDIPIQIRGQKPRGPK